MSADCFAWQVWEIIQNMLGSILGYTGQIVLRLCNILDYATMQLKTEF